MKLLILLIKMFNIKKKFIEFNLVLFVAYILSLGYIFFTSKDVLIMLYIHVVAVVIFSMIKFRREFFYILFSPLIALFSIVNEYQTRKYLKRFNLNKFEEVVIVLGHSDWNKLEAWIKPNFSVYELKVLVEYLVKRNVKFSFFNKAKIEDVNKIMENKNIKEVYFYGHGDSHTFQLCTDSYLYYCEFNNEKCSKEFVHQMHCGTKHGKSLIDYVISEKNKDKCFLARKPINGFFIEKYLKKEIKKIKKN
ncbi:MAG: hypothetical protein PHT84_04435 [Candidatus Pacebacteria bacterium]|nr:hypothetical protein [Candidatus Paceibacterota bacterium]